MDERQWIHAIRKGNKEPLGDIAEKYYDDIYRFCAFQTGSREDAYDLAQETFVRFIRYVESYYDRNLKGYLLTIAMNVCRDYLRRKHRETEHLWYEQEGLPDETRMYIRHGHSRGYGAQYGAQEGSDVRPEAESRSDNGWNRETPQERPGAGFGAAEQRRHLNPERHAVDADVHDRLMQALAQLPQVQREAILLHYLYDMKYREIGRVTDAQVSTVKSRVRQGMEKLQGILRREDFLD